MERDVRQVVNVGDLAGFQTFLRLCAGRVGQLLNLSQLGSDCGVSHHTAKAWLSVLETGFIAFRLRPFFSNLGKREVKTPKLHFYDSGLVCALLGITAAEQLLHHPLRGAIFESWVISEVLKARMHRGLAPQVYFYRDRQRLEVDLLVERAGSLAAVEIKSGQTLSSQFFKALNRFGDRIADSDVEGAPGGGGLEKVLVYGGEDAQIRGGTTVLPWKEIPTFPWHGGR